MHRHISLTENVRIKFDFNFTPVKGDDGEIRLKCKKGHFDYTYEFGDRVTFKANNIFVGKQDVSELVVGFLNQNWKLAVNLVGKPFMNAIMAVVQDFEYKFFTNVPAKYFVSDDLEKYIHDE
ncbi:hypothetical protein EVAR_38464_1 [Eumeta japonica]|uniref:Protein takeout n=1 Tax=Eumeta variegata TaxID=151549 RepID=A0A4C1WLM0_EUMVA|nr:hypothetical protein EVAR_38464_1 [Eumeta japonica]